MLRRLRERQEWKFFGALSGADGPLDAAAPPAAAALRMPLIQRILQVIHPSASANIFV